MSEFGALKQIDAGVLNVGYAEAGPADGPPVLLLHGWPYDIHSYVDVAPLLATAGYRVIIPYLRGFGSTRFLSSQTLPNGQQSALAVDSIALMDGTSFTLPHNAAFSATTPTGTILPSSSGRSLRRSGISTMPPLIAAQCRSTTRITSAS